LDLLVNPGLLERVERRGGGVRALRVGVKRGQPFQCGDGLANHAGDRRRARADLPAAEQDGTGPALPEATAEMRTVQVQLIAEHVEQGRVRPGPDGVLHAIDRYDESHRDALLLPCAGEHIEY
jgi:hypothetical protein